MKTHLRSPKSTFSKFFHTSGHFRPIPATNHIGQNHKNRPKIRKNRFFQKSIYCDIVSGNMIFGRKWVLWTSQSIQKPYIDLPTQYGLNFQKVKKSRIFDAKNHDKKFSKVDFSGRWVPATKPILGIDTPYWCPQTPIILMHAPQPFLPVCIIKNPFKN